MGTRHDDTSLHVPRGRSVTIKQSYSNLQPLSRSCYLLRKKEVTPSSLAEDVTGSGSTPYPVLEAAYLQVAVSCPDIMFTDQITHVVVQSSRHAARLPKPSGILVLNPDQKQLISLLQHISSSVQRHWRILSMSARDTIILL